MIDVSDLMHDPDLAFPFIVIRTTGRWVKGRFEQGKPKRLKFYGPVQPATTKELEQLSIGDQVKGVVKFMCKSPAELYYTMEPSKATDENSGAISDEIEWRGRRYKIIEVMPWDHYGWCRAFGCLKGG